MVDLKSRRAVVTGASRGIGRGVAEALGEAGATVVVTGRTAAAVAETAALVDRAGGRGVGVVCDSRDDGQLRALAHRVQEELGGTDLLVNNAASVPDLHLLFSDTPFWELGDSVVDDILAVGLRSHLVLTRLLAPAMVAAGRGLVINVSSGGAVARAGAILPYGVAKAALDRMTRDMDEDLAPHGVHAVSVWPPPTATPGMLESAGPDEDPTTWFTPRFTGRVIAALAAEPDVARYGGRAVRVTELAGELGVALEHHA